MKIIIVGNGKIGTLLVQELAKEGHDIVVVDNDPDKLYYTQEKMDVAIVVGNGASIEVLREAGAEESDLLLAVTNSDEVNLLTALLAGKDILVFDEPTSGQDLRNMLATARLIRSLEDRASVFVVTPLANVSS